MRQFNSLGGGPQRVWVDEQPEAHFIGDSCSEIVLPARAEGLVHRKVAAEVLLYHGGRSSYGLLGGTFTPSSGENLLVVIPATSSPGRRFEDSALGRFDSAEIGLPPEYARGVMRGLLTSVDLHALPPGSFTFDCSAHSPLNSYELVFARLAIMAMGLLTLDLDQSTDEELRALYRHDLFRSRA